MLLSSEHTEGLIARFSKEAKEGDHELLPIELGSLNQLRNLVHLVSTGEVGFTHFFINNMGDFQWRLVIIWSGGAVLLNLNVLILYLKLF